jgi:CRP-like cAMP-binding protein
MWTGEGCFLSRDPRRVELRARDETWLMHVSLDAMDDMAARDPVVVNRVAQMLLTNVDLLIRIIADLQLPDAARRVASVLQRIIVGR